MRRIPSAWYVLICFSLLLFTGCQQAPEPAAPSASPSPTPPCVHQSFYQVGDEERENTQPSTGEGIVVGGVYAVQAQEYLSLRYSPSTQAPRVKKLSPGALLRVLGVDGEYVRTREIESGARGYVLSDYLVLADQEPQAAPAALGAFAVICQEWVSLRAQPSSGAQRLDRLPALTVVEVSGYTRGYASVTYGNQQGYVRSEYLTPLAAGESLPDPSAADGQRRLIVCEEHISLRVKADASSPRTEKLYPDTQVAVLGEEGDFLKVRVVDSGNTGYVLKRFVQGQAEAQTHRKQSARFNVNCQEYLTLRDSPSSAAKTIGRVDRGSEVELLGYDGRYAQVTAQGRQGYVLAGYLTPVTRDKDLAALRVVEPVQHYGHERMMEDLKALAQSDPDALSIKSVGESVQGRVIPVAVLGDGPKHVLVTAGIHGREHMTSLLVLAQLEYMLARPQAAFKDGKLSDWLEGVTLHILPMVNPDGVAISQGDGRAEGIQAIYQADKDAQRSALPLKEYLTLWKANASGVDLNRNFPVSWDAADAPSAPSSSQYRGAAAADQPETQALMAYTHQFDFSAALNYHAYGSEIYWETGREDLQALCRNLGRAVRDSARYPLVTREESYGGSYKDWVTKELDIPSITVEIGTRACPLPLEEFDTVWARNKNVLAAVARWVQGR